MADVIPVFPLSHVLMPAMPLPLHIFEPRYRTLLVDVRSTTSESGYGSFGVVALLRGSEVDSTRWSAAGAQIAEIGTLAEIMEVESYDDGASDLLTVGSRRFRIRSLLAEGAPYLRAEVDWLDESDGPLDPQVVIAVRRLCREHAVLVRDLTGRRRSGELPRDPTMLSYYVAGEVPLAPADRQSLLECPTTAQRLEQGQAVLRRELSLLRATRSICVAPAVLRLAAHPN